jgi:hypothetical protein
MNPQVFDLIDIRYPVISQVQVLQGSFTVQSLNPADEVVIQVQPSQRLAFSWQPLNLLDFVEGQYQSLKIDHFL